MITSILKKTTVTLSLILSVVAIFAIMYIWAIAFNSGSSSIAGEHWFADAATASAVAALSGLIIDALRELVAHARHIRVPFKYKLHKVLMQNLA